MVSTPKEGCIKEAREGHNNIIIIDSELHTIIIPQLKKMFAHYKVMCGCECFIYPKSINLSF